MKKVLFILLSLIIFVSQFNCVYAHDQEVIRVGYPIQEGLTNEGYTGYTVDYLDEIKKYTGWEYEYVEVEGDVNQQLTTLLEMLKNGEIDLLGAMVFNEALAEIYDYPTEDYGDAYTVLAVKKDDSRWMKDDYAHWDHMKVGIYPSLKSREEELRKFADLNGFHYTLKEYNSLDEVLEAIDNNEVDATLQVDLSLSSQLRSIARFSPKPFYFATTKGNTEIVRELNNALTNISNNNPYLKSELYNHYFRTHEQFIISDQSKEYIQSLGTLNILYFDGNKPLHYEENNKAKGISIDYLSKMSKEIGLKYKLIKADSIEEADNLLQDSVDIVLGLPIRSSLISKYNMKVSQPYFISHGLEVSYSKNTNNISKQVVYNSKKTLDAIEQGYESGGYIDSYISEYYIDSNSALEDLYVNQSQMIDIQYVFSFCKNNDTKLVNIVNSYIDSFSDQELQKIIYTNVNFSYTFIGFIQHNIWQILFICVFIAFGITLLYLKIIRDRHEYQNMLLLQNSRFTNFSSMLKECIFEYDYETDLLQIQNNKILFSKQNHIEHFLQKYPDHYLALMIKQEQDLEQNNALMQNGKELWHKTTIKVVRDKNDKAIYALGRIINIHADVLEKQKLVRDSNTDDLTQLYNRSGAKEAIEDILEQREGCMIIIDVDNFKRINDTYGHPIGDEVLIKLASVVLRSFRSEDIKCRLGGDEFMVFIPILPQSQLQNRLNEFIELAKNEVFKQYSDLQVSMSIGVSSSSRDYQELYIQADEALYRAKQLGKNRYYIYK